MIENRMISVSEVDIRNENDLEKLTLWKMELSGIITSILNKNNADNWHQLPPKAKNAYRYNYALLRMARLKIARMLEDKRLASGYRSERSRRRDRTLAAKFMEVAKQKLPKETYKQLLEIAQQAINMGTDQMSSQS